MERQVTPHLLSVSLIVWNVAVVLSLIWYDQKESGAVIQILGRLQKKHCARCKSLNGPFETGTAVASHQGGSCVTGGNASKCSLRDVVSVRCTPEGVKSYLITLDKAHKHISNREHKRFAFVLGAMWTQRCAQC